MKKILLVEDDEMSRDMLARRLQRKGFNVVLGVDGNRVWLWPNLNSLTLFSWT